MKKNEKIKNILLILVIIAFIAVIISGLIYVKEANAEINNLKDRIRKVESSNVNLGKKEESKNQDKNSNNSVEEMNDDSYINDSKMSIALVNFVRLLNETNLNNKSSLKLGNYLVNEIKVNENDEISNEECGIKLGNNNIFEIYMGYGARHYGIYEVKNNKLICKSAFLAAEVGVATGTNVIFTFDINNNTLKLENIEINDNLNDNEKLVYKEGFTKGMTYSIK